MAEPDYISRIATHVFDNLGKDPADVHDFEWNMVCNAVRWIVQGMIDEPMPDAVFRAGSTAWSRHNAGEPYARELPDIWRSMLGAAIAEFEATAEGGHCSSTAMPEARPKSSDIRDGNIPDQSPEE